MNVLVVAPEIAPFARTGFTISSFGDDEAAELYVIDHAGGAVYRLAGP